MPLHPDDEFYEESQSAEPSEQRETISEGKTLDEAVQKGIEELGISKDEADVEVLDVGGGAGLMDRFRGKNARVRVRAKDVRAARLQDVTQQILSLMQIESRVAVSGADGNFRIEVATEGADGLLIGRRGETLEALQHIVHRIVAGGDGPLFIAVDVSGYRERRKHYLESKARELASVALSQRREVFSEPLTAGERRIFHSALSEFQHIQARALGDGTHRKIAITPANAGRERARQERADRPVRESSGERGDDTRGGSPRWRDEEDRGIPPAPESAFGRDWMRRGGTRNRRQQQPRRNDFLSPSRGFAGGGYKSNRYGPEGPGQRERDRDRGLVRSNSPRRASTRTRYDDEGLPRDD